MVQFAIQNHSLNLLNLYFFGEVGERDYNWQFMPEFSRSNLLQLPFMGLSGSQCFISLRRIEREGERVFY